LHRLGFVRSESDQAVPAAVIKTSNCPGPADGDCLSIGKQCEFQRPAMNANNIGILLRPSMSQCRPTDHAQLISYINYDELGPHFFHFDHAVLCLLNAPT
jgi:hypothetical protein